MPCPNCGISYNDWLTFHNIECSTVADAIMTFRAATFAGGVVTIPYKKAIMPHLDDLTTTLGAYNNIYLTPNGKLRGTNTDWRGIKGCLPNASANGRGKNALVIGAGGASRAALYALSAQLGCETIHVINRDQQASGMRPPNLVHVRSREQARELAMPFCTMGTMLDLQPKTDDELEARAILETSLAKDGEKGVVLDMCFKPRNMRILKLARTHG